jgi:20S proteasome subunit alpha 5
MSGFVADARTLVDHARVETQNHWFTYDEKMGVEACVQSVCDLALVFGEGEMARPFGVALLIGGVDEHGPSLYHVDPSGTQTRFLAKAIGAGSEGAQNALKDHYHKSMTLAEAQKLALQILKDVMEDKISGINVELGTVRADTALFQLASKDTIEAVIKTLDADLV